MRLEERAGELYQRLIEAIRDSDDTELKRRFLVWEATEDMLSAEYDLEATEDGGLARLRARADLAKAQYTVARANALYGAGAKKDAPKADENGKSEPVGADKKEATKEGGVNGAAKKPNDQ